MNQKKYKKRKFVTSLSKRSVKKVEKTTLPPKTKKTWMRKECYIYTYELGEKVFTLNVMEVAERMCKSNKWDRAVEVATANTYLVRGRYPSKETKDVMGYNNEA